MFTKPFVAATQKVTGFAKGISDVLSGFKRIVGYRIIRSIIKEITQGFSEGIKNLYGWSSLVGDKFKSSMDSIATSMMYFKNSIGAAVAPIINALAPALDFLIDKAVALINVINQLLAKLSGATSWTRAKKKATEYGDAVGGAGKAAKDAMRYLAPFDELNVLPDQKDSSGGSGSGDDYSDMFETVSEFNEKISDFAENIKKAVGEGDWQGLGTLLGNKVNELVDKVNFAGLGSKVGGYINAWFTTKYWTLETINFQNIGGKISEFLNNAIGQIDFNVLGRSLVQKFTIIGDLLIGWLENFDFGQATAKLSDFITGVFGQIKDWIQKVDWGQLGDTLYDDLKSAVTGIKFSDIASTLFELLGSAISGAVSLVASFIHDAVKDIWGYFMSFAKDENGDGEVAGGEILEGILKGIVNAVKNIGTWIKDNIWTPFVDGLKSTFGIHSPAATMEPLGKDIGDGLLEGIKNVFKNLKNWIQTNVLDKIQGAIDKGKEIVVTIKTKISEWKDAFNSWLDGLKGNNEGASFNVTAVVNNMVDQIPVAKKKIENMVANFKDKIDSIPVAKKTIDGMKSIFTSVKDSIPSVQKVIGSVKATFTTWENKLSNVWSYAKASFNTWANNLGTPSLNSRANFTTYSDSISGYPNINSRANFVSWLDNIWGTPDVNATASFVNAVDNIPYTPTISVIADIKEAVDAGKSYIRRAAGGVLNHGIWSNIPQYAGGTSRAHGSMFVAGESGPEVVGHIGGRTEVLNKSQLASAMYSSVTAAMSQSLNALAFKVAQPIGSYSDDRSGMSEDTLYKAFVRALNDANTDTVVEIDGDVVYQKMVQRNKQNTRRTGVNAMMAT